MEWELAGETGCSTPGCSRLSKTPRLSVQRPAMGPWLNAHSATCASWPSSAPGQRTRSAAATNAKPRPPGRVTWTAPGVRHSLPFGYPGYCTAPQQQGLGRGARQKAGAKWGKQKSLNQPVPECSRDAAVGHCSTSSVASATRRPCPSCAFPGRGAVGQRRARCAERALDPSRYI